MASRSLNKVFLIGNLTRDPELRYTPQGTPVCSMGLATNRNFVTEGERREETEFHKLVAWNKLAELCSQLLKKGIKIHVEGRLQTRSWQTPDGQQRQTTEIVIEDMMILTPKASGMADIAEDFAQPGEEAKAAKTTQAAAKTEKPAKKPEKPEEKEAVTEEDDFDNLDIPF